MTRPTTRADAPTSYLAVLRLPHALAVFLPALLGRLSTAMVSLSMLFAVHASTGSFAAAGSASGLFGIMIVLSSPMKARLVDRYGQRRALIALAAAYAASLGALAALDRVSAPLVMLVVVCGAAGLFIPPLGAAMRVRWAALVPSPAFLSRAYSLDAVAEELLFVLGPLAIGALVVVASPEIGLIVTAGTALVGTVGMTVGAHTAGHGPSLEPRERHRRPLRQPGFIPLLLVLLGVGAVLGVVEVGAPAFATSRDSTIGAGILLAALSAGSAVGGLVYGRRAWKASLRSRLVGCALLLAATSALLVFMPTVASLAVALGVAGLFLAPSLVTGYLSADKLTHEHVRTEASTWVNTAVNTGAALATAVGGLLVDRFSPEAAFAFGTVVAFVFVGLAIRGLRPLAG